MTQTTPLVAILMGSESDRASMEKTGAVLDDYGITWEIAVISAHRAPHVLSEYVAAAPGRGIKVFVGGAGAAAALPGAIASMTDLPVIGVPLAGTPLSGFDALLSIAQMPPGVPVATVAVGGMGARNAGHLAARILALTDPAIAASLSAARSKLSESVSLPEGYSPK